MASETRSLLLALSILLGLLAISADARPGRNFHPCKSILFISSSSSYYHLDENPNFSLRNPSSTFSSSNGDRFLTFFFTDVQEFNPKPSLRQIDRISLDGVVNPVEKSELPLDFYSSVGSSIRDRTMDIMSVVGALLFGVGCGALTAATMYLIWSLFNPHRFELGDSDDEYDDDDDDYEDDDASPKKMGYAAIPAENAALPQAKEVV